jgi:branched-chain amino acid transport system substrate-binding protein
MRARWIHRCCRVWLISSISLALLACGQAAPQPELRIGVIAPLSGAAAENAGRATTESANLAVKEVNDAGGLEVAGVKYTIKLVVSNDENNPEHAVDVARQLLFQENVVVLIGPQFSNNAIPVASVAETARVPMISPLSTNPETTANKPFVFRVGFLDDAQGQALALFAEQELKASKAAILYDIASAYNRGMAETFQRQFETQGGTIVALETYTTGATDFRAALERIKAAQPDVLFLPNYTDDSINQATQSRDLGMTVPIIGSDGWTASRVAPVPAFEGAFFTQHWHPEAQNTQSLRFVTNYRAAYQREPLVSAALTYDALQLVFLAIQRQKSVLPEDIQRGLASITDYEGVSGTIGYHGNGDPVKQVMIVKIHNLKPSFYKSVTP